MKKKKSTLSSMSSMFFSSSTSDLEHPREKIKRQYTGVGTCEYMSPELIRKHYMDKSEEDEELKEDLPGAAADVFAFSIILWEMYTRQYPYIEFKSGRRFTIMRKVMNGYRLNVSTFTPVLKCLIEACWNHNLHERPSFDVVLSSLRHCKEEILSSNTNWFSKKKKKKKKEQRESLCTDFGSIAAAPSLLRNPPPAPPVSNVVTLLKKDKKMPSDHEMSRHANTTTLRRHSSDVDEFSPRTNRILQKYDC